MTPITNSRQIRAGMVLSWTELVPTVGKQKENRTRSIKVFSRHGSNIITEDGRTLDWNMIRKWKPVSV